MKAGARREVQKNLLAPGVQSPRCKALDPCARVEAAAWFCGKSVMLGVNRKIPVKRHLRFDPLGRIEAERKHDFRLVRRRSRVQDS